VASPLTPDPAQEDERGEPANRFDRYRYVITFALVVVLFTIADAVAGHILAARMKEALAHGRAIERMYRRRDSVYHHDFRPNVHFDTAMYGFIRYPIRTNSLGFKDAEARAVDLSGATRRVLFLGDSFTEGIGVRYESTFVGHLAATASRRGVEVSNGGVTSYSPIIYWRKAVDLIERQRVPVAEVVVFIDVSDLQDEANYYIDSAGRLLTRRTLGFLEGPSRDRADSIAQRGNRRRANPDSAPPLGILSRAKAAWGANSLVLYHLVARAKNIGRPPPPPAPPGCKSDNDGEYACRAGWTKSPAIMALYGDEGLKSAKSHMSKLAEFLRSKQIPLTVVVYPWPEQLRWADRQSLQVSVWREWAVGEHARFIELFEPFFAAADSSSVESEIERDFLHDNAHWNASGHRLVSRLFTDRYCAQAAVDAPRPLETAVCVK
jgi:hypothetical protein